ncbi:actin binding WD repeat protein, coronin Crn1 [Schizosaccharomyces pombe]|uniref:Coronin-like protein crn1 n=1 Tax=Schizosaccharomyces pombe (strain 972 / ATCC 24843) TaxID=284812 RepID=CORO_SCHPO|nr:coronin Crn1 [Schizosaccharomyces pombe]O13923.1 RecName: Full=Coronin-like protein crn1 [Schizosaccharomyces pombe 972h-]CAB16873.1 actin binding protein, coronin Crn1 [Schizosaccharomyces pombe]|eukprot:NP_593175.1 coronin Crn1 [Schizosaccharomyces pombe]
MSGRFVRASKYRHIFGQTCKKELCYDNIKLSNNAWDSNLLSVNPFYLSVNWNAGAGGALAVIPLNERGKLPDQVNLFRGHTAAVLDTDWNPFHDQVLASGGDDSKIMIWKVPEDYTVMEPYEDVHPIAELKGHSRKVGLVQYHPTAANVLASSSADNTIKLWDCEKGVAHVSLKMDVMCQSMSFNADGTRLVTTSRDKKVRVWDPRTDKPVSVGNGHAGAKNPRVVWLGSLDRFATTGFSKMSDRQIALWDPTNLSEPIGGFTTLDTGSGILMPFWDDGTKVIYLAGKGDGNIRYYEYENDVFHYLSEFKSVDPQRGIAFLPKRGVNVSENEVMRAYKSVNDSIIEPISFIVPRRSESFQSDIYPPAPSGKPSLTAEEWASGKDAQPDLLDMSTLYESKGTVEKAVSATVPSAGAQVQKHNEEKVETPKPEAQPVSKPKESAEEQKPSKEPEVKPTTPSASKVEEPSKKRDEDNHQKEETVTQPKREKTPVEKSFPKPASSPVTFSEDVKKEPSEEKKLEVSDEAPKAAPLAESKKVEEKEPFYVSKDKKDISAVNLADLNKRFEGFEKRYEEELAIRDWKIAQLEDKLAKLTEAIKEKCN